MAASVLKSGTSGEVQIGPPEDCTCFIVVPEKHSCTVCFQAMLASSQDERPKMTPVASADSAEQFHDGFRSLIENSLQGILIHRDWQPIFANDALARIFRYREANAILELDNVRELYAERDRLKMFNKTRLAGGEVPEIYEFDALRADGTSIWIQTTVRVVNWNGEQATKHWFIDVTERKRAEQRLARLASFDVLTGLANRAMFQSELRQSIVQVKRTGGIGALILLDRDNFKDVNDSHGHPAGDKLLKRVAKRLVSRIRETDFVAHLSGDEFAIVANNLKSANDAAAITEPSRMRWRIRSNWTAPTYSRKRVSA